MTSSADAPLVALVDVRGMEVAATRSYLDQLAEEWHPLALTRVALTADVAAVPSSFEETGGYWPRAFEGAFARAAELGAHLLVLSAAACVDRDSLTALLRTFDDDPLFGVAHPRFVDDQGSVAGLQPGGQSGPTLLARGVLDALPPTFFVAEAATPCMLIRRELVGNLQVSANGWASVGGFLTGYAVRARRSGFRTVVVNRATASMSPLPHIPQLPLTTADQLAITAAYPETEQSRHILTRPGYVETELLVSRVQTSPRSLLIDARNLGPVVNGTSNAILGLANGLYHVREDRPTILWVSAAASDRHTLGRRFPRWQVETGGVEPAQFAGALRLSQPWELGEILELHGLAAATAYLMLDCIAWDIAYTAPPTLDLVWQFAAQQADGLAFISEFSRQRFARRFRIGEAVKTKVVHLSLDPRDYVSERLPTSVAPSDPFWLLIGNSYDHKHVAPTLDLLTRAFPTRTIVALGDHAVRSSRVRQLSSGSTEERVLQAHYAHASVVIFPSFYEGFGLPVVNALAYSRTVVARDSALMRELAKAYAGPGRLVLFDSEASLVSLLSRLIHGMPVSEVALGGNDEDRTVHGWREAAAALDEFVTGLVNDAPSSPLRDSRQLVARLMAMHV